MQQQRVLLHGREIPAKLLSGSHGGMGEGVDISVVWMGKLRQQSILRIRNAKSRVL